MGVPITFMNSYCPEQFEIVNVNDYRVSAAVKVKAHGLIKDKEAVITERESQDNIRKDLYQTSYLHQEVMDGMSQGSESMHVYSYGSYRDMVARPEIMDKKVYRRMFIRKKVS